MLVLPFSEEIQLIGVADRGIPNKERILARVLSPINLGQYLLTVGFLLENRSINIIPNLLFNFTHFQVPTSSWVVVYTGKGQPEISRLPTTQEPAYVFHWGFEQVLFSNRDIVPAIFHIDAINFQGSPATSALELADRRLVGAPQLTP